MPGAYETKTSLSRAKLSHLMDTETWMNANKTVELGFADGLLFKADGESAVAENSFVFIGSVKVCQQVQTFTDPIAMSVLVLNLRKIQHALLRMLAYLLEILAQNKNWALVQ